MRREWRNEDASRLYLLPTAAYSSTHLAFQPISSMYRMNVYLRRHPTALLTAGTCRRDSLGRPSSRAGASYFVHGNGFHLVTLSGHVLLGISRVVAEDEYQLTISFFGALVSSST
jgi:hypothetical protein